MNRSLRSSKRINKKKAIPLHFQKSFSNSQFLVTAEYKHRIKELKKVNKELAWSLQDVKCRASEQERALAECNQRSTGLSFVKTKIKSIVETVQKLVTDLGEVYDVIDGKTIDFLKNCSESHQEARLQIRNPSISTIEESASMSTIEADLDKSDSLCVGSSTSQPRFLLPVTNPSSFDADTSRTEIYNVPLLLAQEQKSPNVSNKNQSGRVTRSSKSLERTGSFPQEPNSPLTPQTPVFTPSFPLPIESGSLFDPSKLKPISSHAIQKSADLPKLQLVPSPFAEQNAPKPTISKIPVKKPVASAENKNPKLAVSTSEMNRRKTFVVDKKAEEPETSVPVSEPSDRFVLNSLPEKPDSIFDRRGTFVLKSVADNSNQDLVIDRRGTFVLKSVADNSKPDEIIDRRGTTVLKSVVDNSKPNEILDRRATYFIPSNSQKPDPSPPKPTETLNPVQNTTPNQTALFCENMEITETNFPVQNAAPNQTLLLCEDMELTEIIPPLNQSQQFIPTASPCNVRLEAKKSDLCEKSPSSVTGQPSSNASSVKPVSNITGDISKKLEVSKTHSVIKDNQIQNTEKVKKDNDYDSLSSNISSKTKLSAKASASNQVVDPTDLQQKGKKEKDVVKKLPNKEMNSDIKCSAKELPSPIAHFSKTDLSTQHKIFQCFSAVNAASRENKQTFDDTLVAKGNDCKKSTALKDSVSRNQTAVEKESVKENTVSPKIKRKSSKKKCESSANDCKKSTSPKDSVSCNQTVVGKESVKENTVSPKIKRKSNRKKCESSDNDCKKSTASKESLSNNQSEEEKESAKESTESPKANRNSRRKKDICYDEYFSDDESDVDFDIDFMPEKRFSLKPGRKIINPNSKNVFVFESISKKQCTEKDIPTDSSSDKLPDKDFKDDQGSNVFNFSTSSDADKSPVKKQKKRKSVMPKSNKRIGVKRHSNNDDKILSKKTYEDEFSIAVPSRKSILCFSKHSLQSNRKSVRFSLGGNLPQDKINNPNCKSPNEVNANPINQDSNNIPDAEKESSRKSEVKNIKKKYSSARSSSLKATGDVLKRTSAKNKKSRKRQSSDISSDSLQDVCESDCSPKKKVFNDPKKIETDADLNCGKQDEHDRDMSKTVSSEVPKENPVNTKKETNSSGMVSERPLNLEENIKVSGSSNDIKRTNVIEVKRNKSGTVSSEVSKRKPASMKKETNSGEVLSELPTSLEDKVKITRSSNEIEGTDVIKVARPFSGVSERRSNLKLSAVEFLPDLENVFCSIDDDMDTSSFKICVDEPTEIYNLKKELKSVESCSSKDNALATKTSTQTIDEIHDKEMETSFKIIVDEVYNIKKKGKSGESCSVKNNALSSKTPKQKTDRNKKKNAKKSKISGQSKDKENTPNNARNVLELDILTSDNNLCTMSKDSVENIVKPKKSRKKKESAPSDQGDIETKVLGSENAIESDVAASGRSRRTRPVISFKEPSIRSKMRRE